MKKTLLFLIALLLAAPSVSFGQVFGQNQLIVSPFGSNGFVVSTTTKNGAKLSATSSPYFNKFSFTNASGTILSMGTLCLDTCKVAWPTTAASSTLLGDNNTFSGLDRFTNTGTTTFANGLNLTTAGCFAINGVCLQTFIQNATAYKQAVNYATAAILTGTPAYSNGVAGVGATLTEIGLGALSVDGQAVTAGQRILVKNEADQTTNGIYIVTNAGSGIANYILTRTTDYDESTDIYAGTTVPTLAGGTANADTQWTETTQGTIVMGTSNIAFEETSLGTSVVTAVTATTPIISSGGFTPNLTWSGITTSSPAVGGTFAAWNSAKGLYSIASSSLTANPSASVGSASATNGSATTFMRSDAAPACTTATASVPGCLAAADFTSFNLKQVNIGATTTNPFMATYYIATSSGSVTLPSFGMTTGEGLYKIGVNSLGITNGISGLTWDGTMWAPNTTLARDLGGASNVWRRIYFNAASSTDFSASNSLYGPFSGGLVSFDVNKKAYSVSTTSMNASITGSAGSVANAHTVSGTLTGSSYNGSAAISDWAINLGNANTWTALQKFAGVGTTTIAAGLEVGTLSSAPYFNATSTTATSTFRGGIIAGTIPNCGTGFTLKTDTVGSIICGVDLSAAISGGSAGMITAWTSASAITATSGPIASYFFATSSLATSTFQATNIFGALTIAPLVRTGPIVASFRFTGAADTGIAASTEVPEVQFNDSAIDTHANGNVALQRDLLINAPTDAMTSMANGLFTDLATMGISGAPLLGNFATSTNSHTLLLSASALNASTTNSYGLTANANTGAAYNFAAQFLGGQVLIGTSSRAWAQLAIASSTAPQIAMCDTSSGDFCWTERAAGNGFYLATSTALATSTGSAISINPNGNISFYGNSLPIISGGTGTTTGTTNGVPYFNGSYYADNPSLLSFTGTNFGIATSTPWSALTLGSGAITVPEASSTPNLSFSFDFSTAQTQKILLNANTTVNLNHNNIPGTQRKIIACQDGTGSRLITWVGTTSIIWTGGVAPTLQTAAGHCDVISLLVTNATGTIVTLGADTAF